jgi:hypothetical protein
MDSPPRDTLAEVGSAGTTHIRKGRRIMKKEDDCGCEVPETDLPMGIEEQLAFIKRATGVLQSEAKRLQRANVPPEDVQEVARIVTLIAKDIKAAITGTYPTGKAVAGGRISCALCRFVPPSEYAKCLATCTW